MDEDFDFFQPQEKTFGNLFSKYEGKKSASLQTCMILSGLAYLGGQESPLADKAEQLRIIRERIKESDYFMHKKIPLYDISDLQLTPDDGRKMHKQIVRENPNGVLVQIGREKRQQFFSETPIYDAHQKKIGLISIRSNFGIQDLKGLQQLELPYKYLNLIQVRRKSMDCDSEQMVKKIQSLQQAKLVFIDDIRRKNHQESSKYITKVGQFFIGMLTDLEKEVDEILINFDFDTIQSKCFPGHKNPNVVGGLNAEETLEIMSILGSCWKLRILSFSDFSPSIESKISTRLIALMIYHLATAISQRRKETAIN